MTLKYRLFKEKIDSQQLQKNLQYMDNGVMKIYRGGLSNQGPLVP
jgi:hypothetical protein